MKLNNEKKKKTWNKIKKRKNWKLEINKQNRYKEDTLNIQTNNRRHPVTPALYYISQTVLGKGFFINKLFSGIYATQNGKDFNLFRNIYL